MTIEFRQQILPGGVSVGVAVGGGSIGSRLDITGCIIGVSVSLGAAGLLCQLILGIVGIGIKGAVIRVKQDISVGIVTVGIRNIRGKVVGQLRKQIRGAVPGTVPIAVILAVNAAGDFLKPLKFIITVAQRITDGRLVGSQQACGFAVGVGFGIGGAADSPLLTGELSTGMTPCRPRPTRERQGSFSLR